ncbi:MAG: UDP-N-acetylmuramoyl-tripeptide--D-alanyl-D-alanine ligase [Muribaculaceae bacterium]|nr:UDP-N-acetylmuramoyl-tripeptide--D-alanyl-D-alanine ligase [Muribaculaceae bacterium]
MFWTIFTACTVALALFNLWMEMRRDLMMLQQNSYRNERYTRWLKASADSTSTWRLAGLIVFFICLFPMATHHGAMLLTAVFALWHGFSLIAKSRTYKLPLKTTPRVCRLEGAFVLICLVVIAAALALSGAFSCGEPLEEALYVAAVAALGCYCASHLITMAANIILRPWENAINRKYYNDAASRLAAMPDLKVIGITGSYGKTTTKHYLHRILSEEFDTLMTPGSFNTTLGVVRTVREYLKPYHQVFICEMGAKQNGDIREICDLVHPHAGIITAVGPQHLESFKTIENVQSTKFELADAIPSSGLVLLNNDFPKIADRPVSNCACQRYAVEAPEGADWVAEDIEYSPKGSSFTAVHRSDGHRIPLSTKLLGACNISNLLAATAMAKHLGMADEKIRRAVEKIEQVEHRLSIKRIPGGLTILDDAFNSNPVGSKMALDVLAGMPGKRILITPGMIELGPRQAELNEAFGEHAASCCDLAVVVGEYNRLPITDGLRKAGFPTEAIHTVDTFKEAQALLATLSVPGDTVLYENDLPDTFN